MLPKEIVERVVMGGEVVAETFDHATLYFSCVDGFVNVSQKCRLVSNIMNFSVYTLNKLIT